MIENIGAFDPALLTGGSPSPQLSDRIIEHVAEHFNVPVRKLLGAQRSQHVAFCRHVAMYLLRECTDLSYPAIAEAVHRKNHTTALSGYRVIETRMAASPEFRARIEALKREVEL